MVIFVNLVSKSSFLAAAKRTLKWRFWLSWTATTLAAYSLSFGFLLSAVKVRQEFGGKSFIFWRESLKWKQVPNRSYETIPQHLRERRREKNRTGNHRKHIFEAKTLFPTKKKAVASQNRLETLARHRQRRLYMALLQEICLKIRKIQDFRSFL